MIGLAMAHLLAFVAASAAVDPPSCRSDEQSVFACSNEKKGISLCLQSKDGAPNQLRYLFGTSEAIELELPSRGETAAIPTGWEMFASGGTAFAVFTSGSFEYVVYSQQGGGRGVCKDDPDAWCPWLYEGVLVLKEGVTVANVPCWDNDGPSELWRRNGDFAPATETNVEIQSRIAAALSIDLSRPLR